MEERYYYYKIVDENGNPTGISVSGDEPIFEENYIEITYAEYLEICEMLGINPR